MDRREKRLGMGNLVKSPVKSKDKGSFARFWKLRWFVLAEVIFVDADDEIQESKLVLSYYKDKESHEKDEQPKGNILILVWVNFLKFVPDRIKLLVIQAN